jgi:YidC/Oxa1 family membrane protein insertase
MDKRTLIAIVLSILVLILYQYLLPPQKPPKKAEEKRIEKVIPPERKDIPREEKAPVEAKRPIILEAVEEKEIYVETELYKATLTNKGAVIKGWELKRYTDKDKRPVQLLKTKDPSILPLSVLLSEDERIKEAVLKGNYKVNKEKVILGKDKKNETVTFSYQDPSGVSLRKILTFFNNDYRVDLRIETKDIKGNFILSLGQGFGIFKAEDGYAHIGPVSKINGKNVTDKIEKIKEPLSYKGDIAWTAMEDKYFAAALAPVPEPGQVQVSKVDEVVVKKIGDSVSTGLMIGPEDRKFILYAGPKEYDRIKALKIGLEDIIDYGWFPLGRTANKALALPFFRLLKLFYSFINNYGLAIILLTVLIRIVFIPLTNKSQKSMKAMQALAPKINEIKEKYKKDPQRMNKEVMELYKKHKVNPFGGCLPMIIQIPIFIALYNVLMYAIELRGAPFYLWIKDLSVKDPYYILPIAMGISMLIQMKMTPTSVDPMQAKIMMILPIVFTFMFLTFPSGLVLYWLVNNLLTIAQQYYINKKLA